MSELGDRPAASRGSASVLGAGAGTVEPPQARHPNDRDRRMRYAWGTYELDLPARRLLDDGAEVHVEPQVFDVLAHLVQHRDRVVSKQELLEEVWETRFVSESALTSRIRALRQAVGDSGRRQETVRTAHGTGYQFVAAVEEVDRDGDPAARPAVAAPPAPALPEPVDELRGRTNELARLAALADVERLITVLGPGGTGKTRLSVEWARRRSGDQPVVFVDLAEVRDGRALGDALALALGIQAGQRDDVVDACGEFLRGAEHRLILDNCEHAADDASALVSRLLDLAPATTIVATSRTALRVHGEVLFRLEPLPLPSDADRDVPEAAAASAAVALFVDRARRVQQDFALSDESVGQVVDLCRALDGLPLAIELAAGRMGVFGLADLLDRLDQRLDLLGDDRRGRDGRHRTLRTTVEWSYDLLDDDARRFLRHLSVYPAGLSLDGAEWLADQLGLHDPIGVLSCLVEASLLRRTDGPGGSWYTQLETLRTFGIDRLADADELDDALDLAAERALELCAVVSEPLASDADAAWDRRIRRELPNLREARRHLLDAGRIDALLELSVDLDEWSRMRDTSEVYAWGEELLDHLDALDPVDQQRAKAVAAQAAWLRGRIGRAAEVAQEVLDADTADPWAEGRACSALAASELFRHQLDHAAELWRRRHEIDGHVTELAAAALCDGYAGRFDAAQERIDRALAEATARDSAPMLAWTEYVQGEVLAAAGDPDHVRWLESAVQRSRTVGASFIMGVAGLTLATSLAASGEDADAAARFEELVEHWSRAGSWTQQWTTLRNAATLLERYDPALALTLLVAADADPLSPSLSEEAATEVEQRRGRLAELLGPAAARRATSAASPLDRAALATQAGAALGAVARASSTSSSLEADGADEADGAEHADGTARRLATVGFLDVVGSTEILAEVGDATWRARLDELASVLADEAAAGGGTIVKDTGDGALFTFPLPVGAIRFAAAVRDRVEQLDLPLRFGLHTGELEQRGSDVTGVAVVVASRACDLADDGQIVVTATVADLVDGSGVALRDLGEHELKGVPDPRRLLEVTALDR